MSFAILMTLIWTYPAMQYWIDWSITYATFPPAAKIWMWDIYWAVFMVFELPVVAMMVMVIVVHDEGILHVSMIDRLF